MNISIGVVESRQQQRRKLRDMMNRDDLFDVWVRLVLAYAPAIYIFINITLLIWIAQTIFNSKLSSVPSSVYLIAPLLINGPITQITTVPMNTTCPEDFSILSLKSIPTIQQPSIQRKQLTVWGDPGIKFCVKRLAKKKKYLSKCKKQEKLCSGYCVKDFQECPITNIKVLPLTMKADNGFELFFTMNGKGYYYSRQDNVPIISILAAYGSKCANDQHYTSVFDKQSNYWQTVAACKQEGNINSVFSEFDTMDTNLYLMNNNIALTVNQKKLQKVYLGFVNQFMLSTNPKQGCGDSQAKSQNLKPFLERSPLSPQFTQSLLIIAFILLMAEIFWLIAFYCFSGFYKQKNVFVVLMAIIELVIIAFIFAQNQELFYVQKITETLAKCLKQSLPAMSFWSFGIDSPQVFKMVIFVNTIFLGLFISVYLLNSYCFRQLRRRPLLAGEPASN